MKTSTAESQIICTRLDAKANSRSHPSLIVQTRDPIQSSLPRVSQTSKHRPNATGTLLRLPVPKPAKIVHITWQTSPEDFNLSQLNSTLLSICRVVYQPRFRAKRLLSSASTLDTLNCTYSRSRSSCCSFCISSRSSSLRSNSSKPRLRPL